MKILKKQHQKFLMILQFFFSIAIWPKISPNLIFCSINGSLCDFYVMTLLTTVKIKEIPKQWSHGHCTNWTDYEQLLTLFFSVFMGKTNHYKTKILTRCLSVLDFWNVNLGVYHKLKKKKIYFKSNLFFFRVWTWFLLTM